MKGLVLAGGFPQIALIQELQSRGITVVLADYFENPVAKPYADIYYQASTLDVQAITDIAVKEQVDFLITACTDQALLTVGKVSEELGLPCYIDYQTALNVTNKQYMKDMFVKHGVSTARHVIMGELDMSKLEGMPYPLVVKPVDCNSSKGVARVDTDEELRTAFEEAVRLSRTDTAIVETFVQGDEITVDVYVENGKAHVLAISNSDKIGEDDKFVIFRTRHPAAGVAAIEEKVQTTVQQIADAFSLKDCPMLVQMITDGTNVYVLEFSARTGGGVKHLLIQRAHGFDVIKAVVDLTLGIKPHVGKKAPQNKYLVNEFIYCYPGVFDHLEGFDELKDDGVISDYYLFKTKGALFDTVSNSGDRVAAFTVQADTLEEIDRKRETALAKLRVVDANGNDMARRFLTDTVSAYYR